MQNKAYTYKELFEDKTVPEIDQIIDDEFTGQVNKNLNKNEKCKAILKLIEEQALGLNNENPADSEEQALGLNNENPADSEEEAIEEQQPVVSEETGDTAALQAQIIVLEEQNKELMELNDKLLEQLELEPEDIKQDLKGMYAKLVITAFHKKSKKFKTIGEVMITKKQALKFHMPAIIRSSFVKLEKEGK